MEWVDYMQHREDALYPPMSPYYYRAPGVDTKMVARERCVCVDRIYRLACLCSAMDGTCFSAVRLFDRCMGVMRGPIVRTNMMLLAIACFDMAFKMSDSDYRQPSAWTYYTEALLKHDNDYTVRLADFPGKLMEVEIRVLRAADGVPTGPTAQDYLAECCPSWFSPSGHPTLGRRASLACSAFMYTGRSTGYTALQIAVGAANVAVGDSPFFWDDLLPLRSRVSVEESSSITSDMEYAIEQVEAIGRGFSLRFMYRDVYDAK